MSKSKSRQPSRSASGSGKSGVNGAARRPVTEKPTSAATTAKQEPTASASPKAVPSTPLAGKAPSRDAAKYERRQAERQMRYLAQKRARRNRNILITAVALLVVVGGSLAGYFIYNAQHARANGAAGAPFQEAVFDSNNPPIDNVYCDQLEQSVEHIHVHLSIYIDGSPSPLPANIGIPQAQQNGQATGQATCFYWLHVHPDPTNVIHIESPAAEPFTLGQFLDEWNQQFNNLGFPSQLLLPNGWTIWVNGHPYHGSLASVPLDAHNLITIAYNSPKAKPDTSYNWGTL